MKGRSNAARGQRRVVVRRDVAEVRGQEAERRPGQDVGRPIADHPGARAGKGRVTREGLFEEAGGRLAAGAAVLGAVEAEVRAQDDAAAAP